MSRPILFSTVTRSKFDELSEDIKEKKNYVIKEEDGKISKHIAGLEGGGSSEGGIKWFELSLTGDSQLVTINTVEEIDEYVRKGNAGFVSLLGDSTQEMFGYFYVGDFAVAGPERYIGLFGTTHGTLTANVEVENYYTFQN